MSKNINVSLKSNKNNWHFTSSSLQIYDNISLISNNEKRFTQQVAEKIKAHNFMFNNHFPKIVPSMG